MADLTSDERARISRHLRYEVVEPYSEYVTIYLHPAYDRCNTNAAALTEVRSLLADCDTAWANYKNSQTKQQLESAGEVKFSARGEKRLLRTYSTLAGKLATALGCVRKSNNSGGGIKYRG